MKTAFKKSMALVLAAVMLLCALPFTASAATYSGTCGDNLTWSLDTDTGVLNITGTGAMTSHPWSSYCSYIKTVNIASGVTTIGDFVFCDCDRLTSVTIPDSVTTIGNYAFWRCYSLTSVTIPDSVTTIGDYAFAWCHSLTNVTIPDSVTTISDYAFCNCISLTSVTIPDSITTIGDYAFEFCSKLTSITIPDSVTTIGNFAFYSCDSLTSVTIPDSVTTIGQYAFSDCDSLTSVTIPDGVTTILYRAFFSCDSLTSVTIGNSVTTIGSDAFSGCTSLTDVYYSGTEAQWKKITIGSFNECLTNANIHFKDISDDAVIPAPSQTTIKYGDSIILHVDPAKIPVGGYVEWVASNNNFTFNVSNVSAICKIKPSVSGSTTFTATVYDKDGKPISIDEQVMTSKAGFFDKLIAFFKSIFGLSKVYEY